MKPFLLLLSLLLCSPALRAADPAPPLSPDKAAKPDRAEPPALPAETFNIYIELLVVDLSDADAMKLVPQLRLPEQIDTAYGALVKMLETKQARLLAWPSVVTKSGNRSVLENMEEVSYPTDFNWGKSDSPNPASSPSPSVSANSANTGPSANPLAFGAAGSFPMNPVTPTAFETRNVGVTLEIEPNLSGDGTIIEAQLSPAHVVFTGMVPQTVTQDGRKLITEQPRFLVNKASTNISTRNGQRLLLGVFRSFVQPDHTELFLYQATARPVPK